MAEFTTVGQGKDTIRPNLLEFAVLLISFYFGQGIDNGCFKGGGKGGMVKSCPLGNFCSENKIVSAGLIHCRCNFAIFF